MRKDTKNKRMSTKKRQKQEITSTTAQNYTLCKTNVTQVAVFP